MNVAERPEVPFEAAQALARHLQEKPEAANRPAALIAREFGLPESFVQDFLESLKETREPTAGHRPLVLAAIQKAFHILRLLFRRITSQPLSFIVLTTVGTGLLLLLFVKPIKRLMAGVR